jgi:hypothetical protein
MLHGQQNVKEKLCYLPVISFSGKGCRLQYKLKDMQLSPASNQQIILGQQSNLALVPTTICVRITCCMGTE